MASDSLGTMTVGVTANVSEAERALNSLANMLEKFERQQQSRQRSAGAGGRGAGGGGPGGYFSPMSEEFTAEIRRMEMVQKRTESTLRFRQIRQSEMNAVTGRGTEENMRALGEAFKSGDIERLEGALSRANRGIQQVGDSSARARFAVLNLGYGVQDAVAVFGTSGFTGAIKASANNLQGLGVLLDTTKGGMIGIKDAFFSAEFAIMGVATAVLLAASAWEAYQKQLQKAAEEEAKKQMKGFDPVKRVGEAGREEQMKQDLSRIDKIAKVEEQLKEKNAQIEAKRAEQREAAAQKRNIDNQEFQLKRIGDLNRLAQEKLFQQAQIPPPFRAARRDLQLSKEEEEALKSDVRVNAGRKQILADSKKVLIDKQEEIRDELFLLDGERRAMEQRIEVLRKPRERSPEEQETDLEYRLGFLSRTRRDIERRMRLGNQFTGSAQFESSTAYESLARSRMGASPEADTLKRILAAEEKATAALEAIREKLDPGRGARIAILETFE